jgi:3-hydroxyisobutyrate dehydrogenase
MLAAVTTEVIAHLPFCAGWPSAMWAARASLYDADRKSENRSDGEAMSKDNVVVGFVGLGTMGGCMAANVQRAGFKLIVHDLHRQAASHHLAAGAIWADSPRALAREVDVIFSSLPEPSDVEAVALGEDGLIASIKPGAAYFDLSTNSPSVVKKLNAAFALKGAHMLDAPVSGGPAGAASRKLAIWVGGDENVFDRHKAVLDAIGDKAAYIGPIGSATVAKLVHNMSGYALVCALAETFTMGVKAGVEPLALWQAVRHVALTMNNFLTTMFDFSAPGRLACAAFPANLATTLFLGSPRPKDADLELCQDIGRARLRLAGCKIVRLPPD